MGVLYVRVGGAWVPVGPAGSVMPPAEAGARAGDLTQARFGNLSNPDKNVGFFAAQQGTNLIILSYTQALTLWDRDSAGTGYRRIGQFASAKSDFNGLEFGAHPTESGFWGMWTTSQGGAAALPYCNLGAGYAILNGGANGVLIRVQNANLIYCQPTLISVYQPMNTQAVTAAAMIRSNKNAFSWDQANFLAASDGTNPGAFSIYSTYAPMMRTVGVSGEMFEVMNSAGSGYAPIKASAFPVGSSITIKRGVRTLRPERERIVVHHEPFVDEVPPPDIMALRPVAFRPKGEPPRRYPTGHPDVWEHDPPDSPIGIQATRERLGLIAEEVQHVIPSAVTYNADGAASAIDYAQITVALLDHVQRLTDEIATLRYRIIELEDQT